MTKAHIHTKKTQNGFILFFFIKYSIHCIANVEIGMEIYMHTPEEP